MKDDECAIEIIRLIWSNDIAHYFEKLLNKNKA